MQELRPRYNYSQMMLSLKRLKLSRKINKLQNKNKEGISNHFRISRGNLLLCLIHSHRDKAVLQEVIVARLEGKFSRHSLIQPMRKMIISHTLFRLKPNQKLLISQAKAGFRKQTGDTINFTQQLHQGELHNMKLRFKKERQEHGQRNFVYTHGNSNNKYFYDHKKQSTENSSANNNTFHGYPDLYIRTEQSPPSIRDPNMTTLANQHLHQYTKNTSAYALSTPRKASRRAQDSFLIQYKFRRNKMLEQLQYLHKRDQTNRLQFSQSRPKSSSKRNTAKLKDKESTQIFMLRQKCRHWIKTRAFKNQNQSLKQTASNQMNPILKFAKQLFDFWDEKQTNYIPLTCLTNDFIALGLAPNAQFVYKIAQSVIDSSDQLEQHMTFQDFCKIIQGGPRVDKILRVLNNQIRAKRTRKEERNQYFKLLRKQFKLECIIQTGNSNALRINTLLPSEHTSPKSRVKSPGAVDQDNSKQAFQKAMDDLKKGDTSRARNLIRRITLTTSGLGTGRDSIFGAEQKGLIQRKPRRAIYNYKQKNSLKIDLPFDPNATSPKSPKAQDLYYVSYLHRFHQNRLEIKEESKMNRKKMILFEVKNDLKKYFFMNYQVKKSDYKFKLQHFNQVRKAQNQLTGKYGGIGYKLFRKIFEQFGLCPNKIEQNPNKNVKKLIQLMMADMKNKKKNMVYQFPNQKMIYQYVNSIKFTLMYIQEQVLQWWSTLNNSNMDLIKQKDFQNFLISKGIINDSKQYMDISKQYLNENNPSPWIRQSQFLRVFMKSIFKGALMNVYQFVQRSQNIANWLPLSIKVLAYQRSLLMGAFKQKDKQKQKQGKNILNALGEVQELDYQHITSQDYIDVMSEIVNAAMEQRQKDKLKKSSGMMDQLNGVLKDDTGPQSSVQRNSIQTSRMIEQQNIEGLLHSDSEQSSLGSLQQD